MVKILYSLGSCGRDRWFWKIHQELSRSADICPHFIASSKENVNYLLSVGVKKEDISEIFASTRKSKPNVEFLHSCEKEYGFNIWDTWSVTAPRSKKRSKLRADKIMSSVQYIIEEMEKIIHSFQPDYHINYGPSGYTHIIFFKMLQKYHVKIIELAPAVIPKRFVISEDLSNIWPSLIKAYIDIKKNGLPEKEKLHAEKFIQNFQKSPKRPDCAQTFKEQIKQKVERLLSHGRTLLKNPSGARYWLRESISWPIKQKIFDYGGIFEKSVNGEKYVFFPLHFQPEATTLIHGKWYVDQGALLENISKSIPITHKLYVKEHPYGYGTRTFSFYRRIKMLPNVRLISPHANNFELIKKCSLLTTITGTAGWEALLFEKPVITFGNIFYNLFEETKKIREIEELPMIIEEQFDKKIDYNKLIEFVAAMFKCSYPGLAKLPSED